MLTAVEERPTVDLEAGQVATWMVGFRNGRAAAISGLVWRDGNAAEAERFVRVEVSVSMSGPLGPWEPLLSWLPDGAAENPVEFDSPVWARFVRFEAFATGAGTYALPETLRIIERPTEEAYHSVLGEWGFDSPRAIFEFLEEAEEAITAEADDDPAGAQPRPLGTGWTVGAVEAGRDRTVIGSMSPTGMTACGFSSRVRRAAPWPIGWRMRLVTRLRRSNMDRRRSASSMRRSAPAGTC
jgi:predicted thioesterase